jgi:formate dehydrogenase (coenzyme F420) alpha subunit
VSWDEALTTIARKFLKLRDADEARSIASKTSGRLPRHRVAHPPAVFAPRQPERHRRRPGVQRRRWRRPRPDPRPRQFHQRLRCGPGHREGRPRLGDVFLFLGTNQAETHPVTFAHLLRGRAKTGAKLVVIDPRQTPRKWSGAL